MRAGFIKIWVLGLGAEEDWIPCYFLGDPEASAGSTHNLLGLTGVVKYFRCTFDGTPADNAPFGTLVLERL